ncbi:unnamed protein product [Arctia plantaginis]|uniref:Uncharacterized protein n=1 Tax=Arctia plantaginis TaxID=874455 RepID=A0A8S1BE30_ARCPL|nr:unnamed protein product [Arctia plantaginis]
MLQTLEVYLFPRFEALESGATPNYAEVHAYLRDGIALDYVPEYRDHVPLPPHPDRLLPTPDPDSPRSPPRSESPDSCESITKALDRSPTSSETCASTDDTESTSESGVPVTIPSLLPESLKSQSLQTETASPSSPPRPTERPAPALLPTPTSYLSPYAPAYVPGAPYRGPYPPCPPPYGSPVMPLRPPGVTLSLGECETYRALSHVNPAAAHWFIVGAMGRATAVASYGAPPHCPMPPPARAPPPPHARTASKCQRAEKEVPGRRRSAVGESVGDMQAAPARYVSVSELYSTDEVELLLDEIRELEPTSCRGEDLQDFEIAGSGCGGGGGGGGGRSPAGTELTEHSWDSHAQYRRVPLPHPRPLAPLYCRLRHLLTLQGAVSAFLVLCCTSSCACVWAGVGRGVARMPLASRLQLLLLAALSSALLHAALLVMHITRLSALLPLDWNKLGAWTSAWSALSLGAGGALTLHAAALAPAYARAAPGLRSLLLAGAGLALGAALVGGALVTRSLRAWARARRAYLAVPQAPPDSAPLPSTSRDDPL